MGYCIVSLEKKQIAWCNSYNSAFRMFMEFGRDSVIISTKSKIHRKFVSQIHKSWS